MPYVSLKDMALEDVTPGQLRVTVEQLLKAKGLLPDVRQPFKHCANVPELQPCGNWMLVLVRCRKCQYKLALAGHKVELLYYWNSTDYSSGIDPTPYATPGAALTALMADIDAAITQAYIEDAQVFLIEEEQYDGTNSHAPAGAGGALPGYRPERAAQGLAQGL